VSRPDLTQRSGLYWTDKQIAAELGVSYDYWLKQAPGLERAGLPKRDPKFANRRRWSAVKAWLDRHDGIEAPSGADAAGGHKWEDEFT